jgi:hypothetical protein
MTIVSLLDRATNTSSSIAVLVTTSCLFTFVVFPTLRLSLNEEEAGSPPDLRFGYTESELNSWYDAIGEDGCRAYTKIAILDIICYAPSYTLLFGGFLVKMARRASVDTQIGLLMPLVMFCDVVETIIPLYGCFLFPKERLPLPLIALSAACNKLKWTLFMVCNVVLSFLFFAAVLKMAVKKKKKMFNKKNTTKSKKKNAKKKE